MGRKEERNIHESTQGCKWHRGKHLSGPLQQSPPPSASPRVRLQALPHGSHVSSMRDYAVSPCCLRLAPSKIVVTLLEMAGLHRYLEVPVAQMQRAACTTFLTGSPCLHICGRPSRARCIRMGARAHSRPPVLLLRYWAQLHQHYRPRLQLSSPAIGSHVVTKIASGHRMGKQHSGVPACSRPGRSHASSRTGAHRPRACVRVPDGSPIVQD